MTTPTSLVSIAMAVTCCVLCFCSPNDDVSGPGPAEQVLRQTVAAGETVVVKGTGTALDGMSVTMPGSPEASGELRIEASEATAVDSAHGFVPVSPVITIEGPGRVDSSLYILSIPCTAGTDLFAMAFLCDKQGAIREALPLVQRTDSSIIVTLASLSGAQTAMAKSRGAVERGISLVVRAIDEATLAALPRMSTGFRPGQDDWEFTNYGSYIAPRGHCAGQSIGAMWYYSERRARDGSTLFGTFDRTDGIWEDNPQGYRAVSTIQKDIPFKGLLFSYFNSATKTKEHDRLTFNAFAAAIYATGQPQFVGIRSDAGGHAIIAHAISPAEGKLYVCDPNFPGMEREISFDGDSLLPYSSMQNASEPDETPYTRFGFFAKTALIDWDQVGKRMEQMEQGKAGDGIFPSYVIAAGDSGEYLLDDGFVNESDSLLVEIRCSECEKSFDSKKRQLFSVYDTTGALLASSHPDGPNRGPKWGQALVPLGPGSTTLGIAVRGLMAHPTNAGSMTSEYLDFVWLKVTRAVMTITPQTLEALKENDYTFAAVHAFTVPGQPRYAWSFGDLDTTSGADSTITVSFDTGGEIAVVCTLYDGATGRVVATASSLVSVEMGQPEVERFEPATGDWGDTIAVIGRGFGSIAGPRRFMTIGLTDTIKEFVSWSDTLVRFIVPRFSESTWHYLWRDGVQSGGAIFTLKVTPPAIDSLYPVRLHPGDTLTIVGRNFYRQNDGRGSYRPTGVQMYVGPSTSLINGYVWNERLALWSDTLVKLVVPDWAMSGDVFMVCDKDTSARYTVVVSPQLRSIRTIKVEASLFDLTTTSPLDTLTSVSSEVVQFPGVPTQEGGNGTYRLVFDSTYRIESGVNESEKHMLGEANFVFDPDSNMLRSLTISWTETFTTPRQVQPSIKTKVIAVRDMPMYASNANTGAESYLGSFSFVLTGRGACDNVTELSSDQGYFVLQSWGCNDRSILRISMSYLR